MATPPTWSEVTSDPRWGKVDRDKKLDILKNWSDDVKSYGTESGEFDPEKHNAFISTQYKGITAPVVEAAPEAPAVPDSEATQESTQALLDQWAKKVNKPKELKQEEERARIAGEDMATRDSKRDKEFINSLDISPHKAIAEGYEMGTGAGEKMGTSETGKKLFGAVAAGGNVITKPLAPLFTGGDYVFKGVKSALQQNLEGDKAAALSTLSSPETPVTETKSTNFQTGNSIVDAILDVGGDAAKSVLQEHPSMAIGLAQGGAESVHNFSLKVAERMGAEGKPLPAIAEKAIPETRAAWEVGRKAAIEKTISEGKTVAEVKSELQPETEPAPQLPPDVQALVTRRNQIIRDGGNALHPEVRAIDEQLNQFKPQVIYDEKLNPANQEAAATEAPLSTQAELKSLASSSGTDLEKIVASKSDSTGTIRPLETPTAERGLPSESKVNRSRSPLNLTYVSDIEGKPITYVPRTQEQLKAIPIKELRDVQKTITDGAKFTNDELMKLLTGEHKDNPIKASGAMMRQLAGAILDKHLTVEQAAAELRGHFDELHGQKKTASGLTPEEESRLEHEARIDQLKRHKENLSSDVISFREAIQKSGGLPSVSALEKMGFNLSSEFKAAYENKRNVGLIRNDAPHPDILRQNLAGFGYKFETPADLAEGIGRWNFTGKDPEWSGYGGEDPLSNGPGAASGMEGLQGVNPIVTLTDAARRSAEQGVSLPEKMSIVRKAIEGVSDIKSNVLKGLVKTRATAGALVDTLTKLPAYTDFTKNLREWLGQLQFASNDLKTFTRESLKSIPDKLRREAISNWIQAGGDEALLADRARASKNPKLKKGYEMALVLTDFEKQFAKDVKSYFDQMLEQGLDAGVLKHFVENYVSQIWDKETPEMAKIMGEIEMGQLNENFKFSKERFYESFFEGEQKGNVPKTKDIVEIIAAYDKAFKESVAARGFIKQLTEKAKAEDGRPLVVLSGSAIPAEEGTSALFVKPQAKPAAFADYVPLDHPALRGWKWVETDGDTGKSVFLQGQAMIHPEVYTHMKAVFENSAFKADTGPLRFLNPLLKAVTFAKSNLFSLGFFHQLQEGQHALGYGVNPFTTHKIDFNIPIQRALVEHGLQVSSFHAQEYFMEGLSGGSKALIHKAPFLGEKLMAYQQWLFHDYIPGLKMKTAELLFERNVKRYSKEIQSGKTTTDQIMALSADQANVAYGELNYKAMGRHATTQDFFRLFSIAPDFLESRVRNVAQAFTKYGHEQRANLLRIGLTTYVGARILNKLSDDDYHWGDPFGVFLGNKRYGFRILPEDLHNLITEPARFISARTSPLVGTAKEFTYGTDYRGVPISTQQAVKNLILSPVPNMIKGFPDKTALDSVLTMVGVAVKDAPNASQMMEQAKEFNKKTNYKQDEAEIHRDSKFKDFKTQLIIGDEADAKRILREMLKTEQPGKILKELKSSFNPTRPFTHGTQAQEAAFRASLDERQTKRYQAAREDQRKIYQLALKVAGETISER
jgi:hypothetical protein